MRRVPLGNRWFANQVVRSSGTTLRRTLMPMSGRDNADHGPTEPRLLVAGGDPVGCQLQGQSYAVEMNRFEVPFG